MAQEEGILTSVPSPPAASAKYKVRKEQSSTGCAPSRPFCLSLAAQLLQEAWRIHEPEGKTSNSSLTGKSYCRHCSYTQRASKRCQPIQQSVCTHLSPSLLCQFLLLHFLLLFLLSLPFFLLLTFFFLVCTQGCQISLILLLSQYLGLVPLFPTNTSRK